VEFHYLSSTDATDARAANSRRLAPSGQPLPYPPEDQSQEQDRHPLTYDYNCQGTVIVIHAHSSPGEPVTWMPFVARSEEIVGEVWVTPAATPSSNLQSFFGRLPRRTE
jgi:hypothetical protein